LAITFGGICPQNNIHKGTHNTVADAILQLDYDPKTQHNQQLHPCNTWCAT
jgi:hypothetical protein